MRWSVALTLGAALAACSFGCRSNRDVVESQLRARESDVQHLKGELGRSEFHNGLLVRELRATQGLPGPCGVVERRSEPYPVRSLRLGRGTRGRPSDSLGGDDALEVMVEPVDSDTQVIKAPGRLHIEVQEVSTEGLKTPIASYDVSSDQLRRTWQSGLFNTGYKLTLGWKVWPGSEKLRVLTRFEMVDGRVFEADKDITIRVIPEKMRPTMSIPTLPTPRMIPSVTPMPTPSAPMEVIPMPDSPAPKLPLPTPEGPALTSGVGSAIPSPRPIAVSGGSGTSGYAPRVNERTATAIAASGPLAPAPASPRP